MSNKRKLSPQQVAQRDQGLAGARQAAQDPRNAVVVIDHAPDGMQCSWCDCPASDHQQPGYVCGGCPAAAEWVIRLMAYTAQEAAFPVCAGHYDDAARTLRPALPAVPTEVVQWEA